MPVEVQTLAEWESARVAGLLSVVIPAHNEEGHIGETVEDLVQTLQRADIRHEILIINDNGRDRTEKILVELSARHPSVRYVNNDPPNGFGYAVRRGLAEFRGDAVALMMADGSDSANDLVSFYSRLNEGYDCVYGSRFVRGGRTVDYPLVKLVLNRFGNKLIQMLFRIACNDISNAFKLYRREVIAGLQPLLAREFNLTVELPLKAIVRGYRYAVLPNSWMNRKEGVSKFKIREMGSRYFFILLYCLLEKYLGRGDLRSSPEVRATQLQVWHR